jgi:hypothetical protein
MLLPLARADSASWLLESRWQPERNVGHYREWYRLPVDEHLFELPLTDGRDCRLLETLALRPENAHLSNCAGWSDV